jgi:catechol 2,3-dioxygenase-like lactoylglutathione lyase family enzyme
MTTFQGVHHVGIGVAEMAAAMAFYYEVGFEEVIFDYTGVVPGPDRNARVVLLRDSKATDLGPGGIKLVQVLDGNGPQPPPPGRAWGEIGVCEICLHAPGVRDVHSRLVAAGASSLMAPVTFANPGEKSVNLAYVADPWGTKIELIEWFDPGDEPPTQSRVEGVNHVGFGVGDIERTRSFYANLGFTELQFEMRGFLEPMAHWYEGDERPVQHMLSLGAAKGAGLGPVALAPVGADCRGEWGHLGPYEFAIGVDDLEWGLDELRELGIEVLGEPRSLVSEATEWRYAYFHEPDEIPVLLVETLS